MHKEKGNNNCLKLYNFIRINNKQHFSNNLVKSHAPALGHK